MTIALNEFIRISIDRQAAANIQVGFGNGLIFGEHSNFEPDVVQSYSNHAALAAVFTSGDIFNASLAFFGQVRQPEKFKVARRRANVAQLQTVTVDTAADDTDYTVTINGTPFTIDSGGTATVIAIAAALDAAINGGAELVTSDDSAGDGTFTLTADVVGDSYTLAVSAAAGGAISATHVVVGTVDTAVNSTLYWTYVDGIKYEFTSDVDATIIEIGDGLALLINAAANVTAIGNGDGTYTITASSTDFVFDVFADSNQSISGDAANVSASTEITRIRAIDADWFYLMNVHRSTETQQIQDIAQLFAFAQASELKVFYSASISQVTIPSSSTSDVASTLKGLSYEFGVLTFKGGDLDEYIEAGIGGIMIPEEAGSINLAWKNLAGITPDDLSLTQRDFIDGKNANWYDTFPDGVGTLFTGVTPKGTFADVIHGTMKLKSDLELAVFNFFKNNKKVSYTDPAVAALKNVVRGVLEFHVATGFLAAGSINIITGAVADQSAANVSNRLYDGITWSATLAGAINKFTSAGVTQIAGTV